MFESLERRYLFSFGLDAIAPPPAAAAEVARAANVPELIAPVPTHDKLLIEMPAAQLKQMDSHDDVVVEIQLATPQATPSGFMAPPSDSGLRASSGLADTGSQEVLFETFEAMGRTSFTAGRNYLADDKLLSNMMLDRLETATPLRTAPIAPAQGRAQPVMTPFLNDGPHQLGAMSIRSLSIPVGVELQRHPSEAPANSNGLYDRNAPLPRLASLDATQSNVDLNEQWGEMLGDKQARPAVALVEGFDENSAAALNDANAASAYAASDVEAPPTDWGALLPLLPELSPDVEKLGEAFQAVFADLDDLGSGLVDSLADHDRILWGAGAAGVAYYVSSYGIQRGLPVRGRQPAVRQQGGRPGASRNSLTILRLQAR